MAISHTTGRVYGPLNQMSLGHTGEFLTFKQVYVEEDYIRKGEKAIIAVFWRWIDKEDEETDEIIFHPKSNI